MFLSLLDFFGVPHSKLYDRLILDRRPQNSCERRLQWLSLPLGPQLCRILLSSEQTLRGSGYDLSTHFTQLREHESGIRYQAVGRFFYGWECPGYGLVDDKLYILAMNCLGMGDLNSTDIAQLVHEEVLSDGGALHLEGFLRWKPATPVSSLLQGVYIDDGLIAAIITRANLFSPGVDTALAHKVLAALKAAQLDVAHAKGFGACQPPDGPRSSKYGLEKFTIWGTQADGASGDVGASPAKRLGTVLILLDIVRLPLVE